MNKKINIGVEELAGMEARGDNKIMEERKVYKVTYEFQVMAYDECDAKEIAYEYADRGSNFHAKKVTIPEEGVVWLMKLDEMLGCTYDSWEEKWKDFRKKFVSKFGVAPDEEDWNTVMVCVEHYAETVLSELDAMRFRDVFSVTRRLDSKD
jgi:hypothetical protein